MLKLRLIGTPTELRAAKAVLPQMFTVLETNIYPGRGNSSLFRLYAEVELLKPVVVEVEKPHAHQPKKLPKGLA